MSQDNTRRTFLKAIGSAGFTGIPNSATVKRSSNNDESHLEASDLVIPETAVPNEFEPYPDPESIPLLETLHAMDHKFRSAETAVQGYWKGHMESDPEWVISSLAMVAEKTLPRRLIDKAIVEAYDRCIASFDSETDTMIQFKDSHSWSNRSSDWRIDIVESPLSADSNPDPTPILVDHMRHQFFDNVVLGTIVFGPADGTPSVESRIEQYAGIQRHRYNRNQSN